MPRGAFRHRRAQADVPMRAYGVPTASQPVRSLGSELQREPSDEDLANHGGAEALDADEVTLVGSDTSDTEGPTDVEGALEPHMKAIDGMGLLRPPLPKAPGPFRSKREQERLVRNKFRKKSRKPRGKTWQ